MFQPPKESSLVCPAHGCPGASRLAGVHCQHPQFLAVDLGFAPAALLRLCCSVQDCHDMSRRCWSENTSNGKWKMWKAFFASRKLILSSWLVPRFHIACKAKHLIRLGPFSAPRCADNLSHLSGIFRANRARDGSEGNSVWMDGEHPFTTYFNENCRVWRLFAWNICRLGYAHMLHHPVKPGGGPTTKAVIFAQLVTDYCRFETIRDSGDANAIPKCPEDLHYWANATRLRWR